jgi:hypothetical protein
MLKKRKTNLKGFTVVELMMATVVSIVVILGIAVVLADSHRGWNAMYDRVYSDVVSDGYAARKAFDRVIRQASSMDPNSVDTGNWVEVYYYSDANSSNLDRYARFYCEQGNDANDTGGGQLYIEYGLRAPGVANEALTTQTLCRNVQSCIFMKSGRSAQMLLVLDNGSQTMTVASSAVMQND